MSKTTFNIAALILVCTSSIVALNYSLISRIVLQKAIQENPEVILNVIKNNPQTVLDVVQKTQKANQEKAIELIRAQKRTEDINNPKQPEILEGRPMKPGSNLNAPVSIVVYSSFQCPKCAEGSEIIDNLMAKYPGKLKVYFKHLTGDTLAFQQALLFEATAAQDPKKAWLLHDYMFENMLTIKSGGFDFILQYAKEIGLDFDQLPKDMYSQTIRDGIRSDLEEGKKFGIQGTPTFFINGISITGARQIDEFFNLIDSALTRSSKKIINKGF